MISLYLFQSGAPENIDLKDTWFTTDPEEDPRKTPSHETSVAPENVMSSQYVPHVQEGTASEGASVTEVIECTDYEGVRNTSNLNKILFYQQSSHVTSGMTYRKVEKIPKLPKMMDLESTGFRRSDRLDNIPKQNYSLFSKLSLAVIGACEVANNPHIFLIISNKTNPGN